MSAAAEAAAEKELGNAAYKAKDFAAAHRHYDKAAELDPNDITFLNNKAAVLLEEGRFDDVVALAEKAVDKGRETRADYKLIARALERAGKALHKKGDLEAALKMLDKSLSEHREQKVVELRKKVDTELKEAQRKALFDPAKAEEAKLQGNAAFKEGRFADAKKFYDTAIQHNGEDAKLFSNRAAAYAKLMAFQDAVADCDRCIRLEPTFLKGFLRKGTYLNALHEYKRAAHAFEEALKLEPGNAEAKAGLATAVRGGGGDDGDRPKGLDDPRVQEILADPGMRMILEQAQSDPKALQDHLKNPDIANKIKILIEGGVIGVR